MAKISLSKLISKKKEEDVIIEINGEQVEVKQYLPLTEKIELVNFIAQESVTLQGVNPIQKDVLTDICIIEYYTNIKFTEKQKEDMLKTYDILVQNNIIEIIKKAIPEAELSQMYGWIYICMHSIETFKNSARGMVDDIVNNYNATQLDIQSLVDQIKDPQVGEFLKNLTATV
jgi:hypothetical protein